MYRHRINSFAILALLPLALTACGGDEPADPRTQVPKVRVESVQSAARGERAFSGIVAARVQSDLAFRVSGKVLQRLVDTGQSVKRGQVLMRIDPVDLELTASAQHEAQAAARARAVQTAADEVRYRDLVAAGAVSASAYDQIKSAADAARAQLSAAEAQARVARNASDYALLYADADGVVVETLAETGQVVSAGQPVVRLARAGRREAVVQLPETLRPAVGSVGQASLYGQMAHVPARLRQLSDAADHLTRTYEARYVLEGELADAPLGATVNIRIADGGSTASDELVVPVGALFDAGKGPGVWLVNGQPSHVSWRSVELRSLSADAARVSGSLKSGDQVVALGAHLLKDGETVQVLAAPLAAPAVAHGARQ